MIKKEKFEEFEKENNVSIKAFTLHEKYRCVILEEKHYSSIFTIKEFKEIYKDGDYSDGSYILGTDWFYCPQHLMLGVNRTYNGEVGMVDILSHLKKLEDENKIPKEITHVVFFHV